MAYLGNGQVQILLRHKAVDAETSGNQVKSVLRANFTTAQLANPAISGSSADPANDGLPNLMKYALDLNPNTANANPFIPMVTNGVFTVSYPLSTAAVDVILTPQWSTNLAT